VDVDQTDAVGRRIAFAALAVGRAICCDARLAVAHVENRMDDERGLTGDVA
jgi:hypothetical protein